MLTADKKKERFNKSKYLRKEDEFQRATPQKLNYNRPPLVRTQL